MSEEPKSLTESESEMAETRCRLIKAREAAGKSHAELAKFAENISSYYDMENCNGDIYYTVSLRELAALCSALGVSVRDLFDHGISNGKSIGPDELMAQARQNLDRTGMSVSEFEDRIGFTLEKSLSDSSQVMNWNVDFLRWFCHELKVDWRMALP